MRKINEIIVHCTDTTASPRIHAIDVDRWHKERGFWGIGYHYLINVDGQIELGRPIDMIGAHCKGHNANSVGICYVGGRLARGGVKTDTRTLAQKKSIKILIQRLRNNFGNIPVQGHNYYNKHKACPCFDADAEYN